MPKLHTALAAVALTGAALVAVATPASAAQAPAIRWQPPASSINWSPTAAINWAPTPQAIPPIKPGWFCWAVPWC